MTNWIKGMALAPMDRRLIKAFGIATWPDGTEHPEMRFIWRDWREMPAATIEEPNKVIRLDETWEPQTPHPFRPTHWAEADKPPLEGMDAWLNREALKAERAEPNGTTDLSKGLGKLISGWKS